MTVTCLREARRSFAACTDLHPMRSWLVKRLTAARVPDAVVHLAVTVVNELAANAVRHTASGRGGGAYSVMFEWRDDCLSVAVTDQGGARTVPTAGDLDDLCAESGRGLAMVALLADSWGHQVVPGGGRRTWATIAR